MAGQDGTAVARAVQAVLLDDPGFLRGIVQAALQAILEAEMTAHLGAEPYARGPGRTGHRNGHAAVNDPQSGNLLLFGGATAEELRGDTWRRHDGRWRRLPITGPAPRTFPAMAYDSARGEVVLFGGNRVLFGDSTRPAALPRSASRR